MWVQADSNCRPPRCQRGSHDRKFPSRTIQLSVTYSIQNLWAIFHFPTYIPHYFKIHPLLPAFHHDGTPPRPRRNPYDDSPSWYGYQSGVTSAAHTAVQFLFHSTRSWRSYAEGSEGRNHWRNLYRIFLWPLSSGAPGSAGHR